MSILGTPLSAKVLHFYRTPPFVLYTLLSANPVSVIIIWPHMFSLAYGFVYFESAYLDLPPKTVSPLCSIIHCDTSSFLTETPSPLECVDWHKSSVLLVPIGSAPASTDLMDKVVDDGVKANGDLL